MKYVHLYYKYMYQSTDKIHANSIIQLPMKEGNGPKERQKGDINCIYDVLFLVKGEKRHKANMTRRLIFVGSGEWGAGCFLCYLLLL